MNLSIVNIKKAQLNAQSTETVEAPEKKQVKNVKPDYTGVPEADADATAIKAQKKTAKTKARAERKVAQKKAVSTESASKVSVKVGVKAKAEPKPKKEKEQTKLTLKKFSLIHYSEKSIALFGDTKPIKEDLKSLGGRYNANLHPFGEESRVPGWVFPKKCEDAVRELVNL
jgi:hypothetical protein